MRVAIRAAEITAIEAHVESTYPNEGAGFLLGKAGGDPVIVEAVRTVDNRREMEARFNRYELGPQDFAQAEMEAAWRGLDVVGVFHSHPDHPTQPSQFDLDHALPNFCYLITSVEGGVAGITRAWQLRADRSAFDEGMLEVTETQA